VLEVRADAVSEVTAAVRERMVEALQLKVPLKVDTGVGANWTKRTERGPRKGRIPAWHRPFRLLHHYNM